MASSNLHGDEDPADYERLRNHLRRPRLEHPAPGAPRIAPARPGVAAPRPPSESQISVVDWIVAIGHAVARRLRGAPRSAMVPLHPRE